MKIIPADQRLAEARGVKALIGGDWRRRGRRAYCARLILRVCSSSTSKLAISPSRIGADSVRVDDWPTARDLACRIGGPNLSFPPTACYSQAHFSSVGGEFEHLDKYSIIFVDSITALSRLSFRHAEQQPEAFTPRGAKDTRSAYGLHAREMLLWLHQLQHARGKTVVFVGILEKVVDRVQSRRVRPADGRGQDWS